MRAQQDANLQQRVAVDLNLSSRGLCFWLMFYLEQPILLIISSMGCVELLVWRPSSASVGKSEVGVMDVARVTSPELECSK